MTGVLLVAGTAVIVGSVVQGCTGFGFGIIVLTPLISVLDQRAAVPIILMLSMLNTTPIAVQNRDKIHAPLIVPLAIGGVLGIPFGIAAMMTLDGPVFRIIVGAILVVFAIVLWSGWRRPVARLGLVSFPVGIVSGLMNGSTSMTGPPVILFLSNQELPKDVFRANIVTHFTLMNVVSLSLMAREGLLTREVLTVWAALAPVLVAGTWAGTRLSARVSELRFRQLTLALAIVMGAALLLRNAPELIVG